MLLRLLKYSGYLLYTMIVLSLLLWYKFPTHALKDRIEKDLNKMTPTLQWTVQEVALSLPFHIQLRNISVTGKEDEKVLLVAETMHLGPDVRSWKKSGNITAKYTINLLKGTVAGRLRLQKDQSALEYEGRIQEVKVDSKNLAFIQQEYQRTLHGTLSGEFSGIRKMNGNTHTLQGTFQFAQGKIELQYPVLGMEELVFDRIESKLNLDTETLSLSKGKVSSPLFAADFKGKLHTTVPCRLSRIQLTGSFHPRPEFTSSLDSPSLVNILKKETLKGNLPFTVNGLLQEPGIMFTTLPPAFNNMMGLQKKKSRHVPERSR